MPRLSLNRMLRLETEEELGRRKAFEKKMARLEQETAFRWTYGHFRREIPPPGHTRPILGVHNIHPISETGRKRFPRSRTSHVKTRKSKPKRKGQ